MKLFQEGNNFKGCKLTKSNYLYLLIVPPQEGGIDYKKQYELLQIANLVLSDQITLLQYHTKIIKDSLDVNILTNTIILLILEIRRSSTRRIIK